MQPELLLLLLFFFYFFKLLKIILHGLVVPFAFLFFHFFSFLFSVKKTL